jgi:uncharacterized membrane protein
LSESRTHLDLKINMLTEQENTKKIERFQSISRAVGASDRDDPSLEVLEQATRPDKLAEQIARADEEERARER